MSRGLGPYLGWIGQLSQSKTKNGPAAFVPDSFLADVWDLPRIAGLAKIQLILPFSALALNHVSSTAKRGWKDYRDRLERNRNDESYIAPGWRATIIVMNNFHCVHNGDSSPLINLKNETLRFEPSLGVKMAVYSEERPRVQEYSVEAWRTHFLLLRVYHGWSDD